MLEVVLAELAEGVGERLVDPIGERVVARDDGADDADLISAGDDLTIGSV